MSKGNMFLGYARGKVGDVVMYRQDGEQITRAHNKHPRNPQTEKQQYQRAVMASVLLAYKAGSEIFDHSFQGYSKGAACQRRFLSQNARLLRTALAEDLANISYVTLNPNRGKSRVVAPGSISPTPWEFLVSEGTYTQGLFGMSRDVYGDPYFALPDVGVNSTVAQYAAANGLVAGDIYTFVALVPNLDDVVYIAPSEEATGFAFVYNTRFVFVRYIVKSGLEANNDQLISYNQLFNVSSSAEVLQSVADFGIAEHISISKLALMPDDINIGAIGVIRSREDADLRSKSQMYLSQSCGTSSDYYDGSGLTANWIADAWFGGGENVGRSELILEGGGLTERRGQVTRNTFETQTVSGTDVTVVGIEYISGIVPGRDPEARTDIPVAVDASGNKYYLKNGSMSSKWYGQLLFANQPGWLGAWNASITGATNANTIDLGDVGSDSMWEWIFENGITAAILIDQD